MSNTNSFYYLPIPPRVWSRVQSNCTYTDEDSSYNTVYVTLSKEFTTLAQANYETQMYAKGNVLQYKGNSARLTKKQKYSQLANGGGPSRRKVFATQSQTYTNPNTAALQRVNAIAYVYPNQIVGAPNNPSGPFQFDQNPFGCNPNIIEDGGSLVCGTLINPCSGTVLVEGSTNPIVCNPASASNVPGSDFLCWNKNIQTWFPRQRYTMNNSGNKFPQGYKGLQGALVPAPPLLELASVDCGYANTITLSWTTTDAVCLPLSSFRIYQNGQWIATQPYPITSYTFNLSSEVTNTFFVTAVSYNVESQPSNVVTQAGISTFSATGNYTVFRNNCFLGVVFDYQPGPQTLTLNNDQIVTLIVVGGGGGGASNTTGSIQGGTGGGGGGTTYVQNLYLNAGTYSITVGAGGQGTISPSTAPGQPGGNSSFGPYVSYGGTGGNTIANFLSTGGGCNTVYGGGGGMGGVTNNFAIINSATNNLSGVNAISGNQGTILTSPNISMGGSSFYAYNSIPIFTPFISLNSTITVGGGGGAGLSGAFTFNGGGSGMGIGGAFGGSSTINGENGYNSVYTGYGGGGGGGGQTGSSFGNGGNGGNGAVIVYWPPYNSSYINTDSFIGNFQIYQNNGYIGYVFNYGSGTITFNQPINNVNMILCGGGGCGSDGSANPGNNVGGGGGGGGSVYTQGLSFTTGEMFNITVGAGGTYSQPNGSNTLFGFVTAQGGFASPLTTCNGGNGGDGSSNGGGGGGGGGGVTLAGNGIGGSGGGINPGGAGQGTGAGSNGGDSYLYTTYGGITMPFLPGSPITQLGGGGQSGSDFAQNSGGGGAGLGEGANNQTQQLMFGGNGINNIYQGFGGGGGGGNFSLAPYATGGSGGNGVIILWWQL